MLNLPTAGNLELTPTSLSDFSKDWRSSLTSHLAQATALRIETTTPSHLEAQATRVSGSVGQRQSHTRWISTADLADRLDHRRFELKMKTGSVAMHLSSDWRAGLFRQIDGLLAEENWEPIDELPSLASYTTAMRLLIFLRPTERPGIGLSHDGNVVLTWSTGGDHLTIECKPDDAVRWIVANTQDDVRERAAGDSTAKRIPAVVSAYEPQKWLNPQ